MAKFFELDASDKNNKKLIIGNLIGATEWMEFRQKMEKDPENAEYKPYRYVKCVEVHGDFTIPDHAFENFIRLTEVISTGPGLGVGRSAFEGCESLQTVNAPKLDFIGAKAFAGCSNLNELDISGVEGIGEEAFAGCTALKIVNVPNVEAIQKNAFQGCDNLEKIEGLGKIKDVNSLYELGCSEKLFKGNELIKLSELKGSYKESDSNIYADTLHAEYKNFKLKCNSMCTNGKAKKGAFKECARYFMEKVLKPMTRDEEVKFKTQVENLLESNSEVKISKNYFSDFNQLVLKKCLNVLNSVSKATTLYRVAAVPSCSIEEKVEDEVKKLQLDIKNYVLKKYNGLLSAGLKS